MFSCVLILTGPVFVPRALATGHNDHARFHRPRPPGAPIHRLRYLAKPINPTTTGHRSIKYRERIFSGGQGLFMVSVITGTTRWRNPFWAHFAWRFETIRRERVWRVSLFLCTLRRCTTRCCAACRTRPSSTPCASRAPAGTDDRIWPD